eukprot:1751246-Prymnesium_polylepis.1
MFARPCSRVANAKAEAPHRSTHALSDAQCGGRGALNDAVTFRQLAPHFRAGHGHISDGHFGDSN